MKEAAPSEASKAELLNAAILVLHREPSSLMRNNKEKKMRDILATFQGEDVQNDEARVQEIAASWLQQLEEGTLEQWEVYGAALSFIAGNRRPHFAQKPRAKKQCDASAKQSRRGVRKRTTDIARETSMFMRQFKECCPLDVIVSVKKLVQDQVIPTDDGDAIVQYFEDGIGRLELVGASPSLRALDIHAQLKCHLEKGEVESWQVLRIACNHCWRKAFGYPAWAKPKDGERNDPKELEAQCREDGEEQSIDAQDADDKDDEFAEAFQDATTIPVSAVQPTEPTTTRDDDTHRNWHEDVLAEEEKGTTFSIANPSDMTMEQMKDKREFYRLGARRNPQEFLQKFIDLNNKICHEYEASQRQIRETAKKAMEELRREPSPSPERVPKQRERVNIIGRINRLEGLERQRAEHKKVAAQGSDQKSKRQRKTEDVQPQNVQEAILKHLPHDQSVDTDVANKQCSETSKDPDLFEELWGPGPNEDLDLEQQLELDLSEL